jgi:hypothetical protein
MFREQVMRMRLRTTRCAATWPGTCNGWLSPEPKGGSK